jgi:hypothetical protein
VQERIDLDNDRGQGWLGARHHGWRGRLRQAAETGAEQEAGNEAQGRAQQEDNS